jgi:hypothetical protein
MAYYELRKSQAKVIGDKFVALISLPTYDEKIQFISANPELATPAALAFIAALARDLIADDPALGDHVMTHVELLGLYAEEEL